MILLKSKMLPFLKQRLAFVSCKQLATLQLPRGSSGHLSVRLPVKFGASLIFNTAFPYRHIWLQADLGFDLMKLKKRYNR